MKSIRLIMLSAFFFALSICLFAETDTAKINTIADSLFHYIENNNIVDKDRPVFIDLKSPTYFDALSYRLTDLMLKKDYNLISFPDSSSQSLQIYEETTVKNRAINYYLFTRESQKTYPVYFIRVHDLTLNKIVYSDKISFEKMEIKQVKSSAQWYEHVLLATVIGSLIYLLYYGNN